MRTASFIALPLALILTPAGAANAQVRVNPTGVNVAAHFQTTVLLTFSGLSRQRPAEGEWCGDLIPAVPGVGLKCNPATLFGVLPIRYDLSALTGPSLFSDVMSIPVSVTRRAYEAAERGDDAAFFFVRRFVSLVGGPDEFVAVTCRLTGGGATVPLSLVDVQLGFAIETPVVQVEVGQAAPASSARIQYTGTGRLVGRWEIVVPGQDPPTSEDLLPEASLPPDRRGSQRRWAEIDRFNVFLPATGRYTLPGPEPGRLPTATAGQYLLLLRVEASDDAEADRELGAAIGAGTAVRAGGVAGFPMPVLRYVVGAGGSELAPVVPSRLDIQRPADGATMASGQPIDLAWSQVGGAAYYRVDIESGGQPIHTAYLAGTSPTYRLPPFVLTKVVSGAFRWRVGAIDAAGRLVAGSDWHRVRPQSP